MNSDLPLSFLFVPLGFAVGVIFSVILIAGRGRLRFERMSLARFAGWGAASGFLLSGIIGAAAALRGASVSSELLLFGPALTAAGAACAAGSLALARRAERRELHAASASINAEVADSEAPSLLERGG